MLHSIGKIRYESEAKTIVLMQKKIFLIQLI